MWSNWEENRKNVLLSGLWIRDGRKGKYSVECEEVWQGARVLRELFR